MKKAFRIISKAALIVVGGIMLSLLCNTEVKAYTLTVNYTCREPINPTIQITPERSDYSDGERVDVYFYATTGQTSGDPYDCLHGTNAVISPASAKVSSGPNFVMVEIHENTTVTLPYTSSVPHTLTVEKDSHVASVDPTSCSKVEAATVWISAEVSEEGYEFYRWTSNAGGTFNDAEYEWTYFYMPPNDVTITAESRRKQYTVEFDANGQGATEGMPDNQRVYHGDKATEPASPGASEKRFDGWYREPGCNNLFDFDTIITENVTLYAKWIDGPKVTTESLPDGKVGTEYSRSLLASDTSGAVTWSIAGGKLPDGLALSPSTGVISGTPTAGGTFNFTVKVKDHDGLALKELSIKVLGDDAQASDKKTKQTDEKNKETKDEKSKKSKDDDTDEPAKPAVVNPDTVEGFSMIGGQMAQNVLICKMKQGPAAVALFKKSCPKGWLEAFTFNIATNGKYEHTLKNGVLTIHIPKEYRKAGRTFALMGLDKNRGVIFLNDTDKNPDTLTVNLKIEGYAFDLIYKD